MQDKYLTQVARNLEKHMPSCCTAEGGELELKNKGKYFFNCKLYFSKVSEEGGATRIYIYIYTWYIYITGKGKGKDDLKKSLLDKIWKLRIWGPGISPLNSP